MTSRVRKQEKVHNHNSNSKGSSVSTSAYYVTNAITTGNADSNHVTTVAVPNVSCIDYNTNTNTSASTSVGASVNAIAGSTSVCTSNNSTTGSSCSIPTSPSIESCNGTCTTVDTSSHHQSCNNSSNNGNKRTKMLTEEEKRQYRMECNRKSATASRLRRKALMDELKNSVDILAEENGKLKAENQQLREVMHEQRLIMNQLVRAMQEQGHHQRQQHCQVSVPPVSVPMMNALNAVNDLRNLQSFIGMNAAVSMPQPNNRTNSIVNLPLELRNQEQAAAATISSMFQQGHR